MKKIFSVLVIFSLIFTLSAFSSAETELNSAYVYYEDGMPKYWLDFTGTVADNLVLHCFFKTDHWEETFYILDFVSASENSHQGTYRIEKVYNAKGADISDWFRTLSVEIEQDNTVRMYIERNDSTLAGGPDSTIQSGLYLMTPSDAGTVYECFEDGKLAYWIFLNSDGAKLHFASGDVWTLIRGETKQYSVDISSIVDENGSQIPFHSCSISFVQGALIMNLQGAEKCSGVFMMEPRMFLQESSRSPEQIGRMAQMYYARHFGFYPPEADVDVNQDGTFTVHLYEIVNNGDGTYHTATSAWYTVDASGVGVHDIFGTPVDLIE